MCFKEQKEFLVQSEFYMTPFFCLDEFENETFIFIFCFPTINV